MGALVILTDGRGTLYLANPLHHIWVSKADAAFEFGTLGAAQEWVDASRPSYTEGIQPQAQPLTDSSRP